MRKPSSTLGSELDGWEIRATSRSFLGARPGADSPEFAQWRTPPPAPKLCIIPRLLNLRFSVMLARALHSYEPLPPPAAAPLQDLVQERRAGGADAEGLDQSEERQGD